MFPIPSSRGGQPRRLSRRNRPAVHLNGPEALDVRAVPAVVASFSPAAGMLTVLGDAADNVITIGRNAAGMILVNGGAVAVLGGTPTVANTALISVFGQGGNDQIALNEANGAPARGNPLRRRR